MKATIFNLGPPPLQVENRSCFEFWLKIASRLRAVPRSFREISPSSEKHKKSLASGKWPRQKLGFCAANVSRFSLHGLISWERRTARSLDRQMFTALRRGTCYSFIDRFHVTSRQIRRHIGVPLSIA